jgi:hypothetical protein
MKVTLDPVQNIEAPAPAPKAQGERPSAPVTPRPEASTVPAPVIAGQPAVTFRKDSTGKIFYVVTDSQSGKEIREVPAAAVRKAGEGIDEFLKQRETKQTTRLEVKA